MPHTYVPFRLLPAPARSDLVVRGDPLRRQAQPHGRTPPASDVSSLSGGRWSIRRERLELMQHAPAGPGVRYAAAGRAFARHIVVPRVTAVVAL
jgi:hypothetical protein